MKIKCNSVLKVFHNKDYGGVKDKVFFYYTKMCHIVRTSDDRWG